MRIDTNFHNLNAKKKDVLTKKKLDKDRVMKLRIAQEYLYFLERKTGNIRPLFKSELKDELSKFGKINKKTEEEILESGLDYLKELLYPELYKGKYSE
jgi:hypothetical protein